MPTVDRAGVSIYYEVVEGSGPPLVLLHGGMGSSEMWRFEGYVDALRDAFRLVLVDLRGHGRSDAPHDPSAYRIDAFIADIGAVLDALGLRSAALCGFSIGGTMAFAFAAHHPERCDAIVSLDGEERYVGFEDAGEPDDDNIEWAERFEREGMGWVVAQSEDRPAWAQMIARTDPLAMAAHHRALASFNTIPGLRFHDLAMPLLAFMTEESVKTVAPMPSHAQLVVIPTDHVGVVEHHEIVWPLIRSLSGSSPHRA